MASYQYIYVMKSLSKIYPGGKEVLKNIRLAFLPGAKIGVLGANGAGKSTLLKIMAGHRQGLSPARPGRPTASRSATCRRSRSSIPTRTCWATSWRAWPRPRRCSTGSTRSRTEFAEPLDDDEMNALLAEQAELQEKIDAGNGWELQRTVEIAMDALRCPPGDADVTKLSGGERRRVALCRLLLHSPTCCCSTSRPTISTPNWWPGWSASSRTTRAPWWRSPTTATSSTTSPAGSSSSTAAAASPTRATTPAGSSRSASGWQQEEREDQARQRTLARELEWIGQSPQARQAKSQGAHHRLRGAAGSRPRDRGAGIGPDRHPARPAAGRPRDRGRAPARRASATGC